MSISAENIAETQVADPNTLLVVNYDTGGINATHTVPDTLVVYSTNGDWTATLEMVNETFFLPGDIKWNVTPGICYQFKFLQRLSKCIGSVDL